MFGYKVGGMSLFSNIIAPLIAGLFFLLYFIYFIVAYPSKAPSYKYFILFLIGISLFSLGRTAQLVLGPYPMPLIIVNLRMILLCGFIVPVIILASDLFNRKKRKIFQTFLISFSIFLGIVYVLFNTLGTQGSRELFQFAGLVAYDNNTPSMNAPYYGREVTIVVQVLTGLLLALFSLIKLIRLKIKTAFGELLKNKVFLFNSGVFIFAFSFIVGSLAKQWGIYYAASIFSALLFGWSVLIDIRELYHYYEKLIPFIKEDIIHNVAFSGFSKDKLTEMLDCLGKKSDLNTFVIIKIHDVNTKVIHDLETMDTILKICDEQLSKSISDDCFIILPLSNNRVGIAFRILPEDTKSGLFPYTEILETIKSTIITNRKCELSIGIGRSYDKIEDLRMSYHEALNAQDYAERFEYSSIVHVDDIKEPDNNAASYPVKEKEKLLSLIKVGDVENSRKAFDEFIKKFKPFILDKPDVLKVRLYEFIGSIVDAAILGGGNEKTLNANMAEYFKDINHIKDLETVETWMSDVVADIASLVAQVYESRSRALIKKALIYMDKDYKSALSYKDVAAELFISPSYFLALFKKETGYTFVDYLTMLRMEKAKALLINSNMSITDIAYETGFNNSNYFSSLFKKTVGITAKEYRGANTQQISKNSKILEK